MIDSDNKFILKTDDINAEKKSEPSIKKDLSEVV